MNSNKPKRLSREDWLKAAIGEFEIHGVDGIKVVVIAERLGSTSGSFYWHFKSQSDLLDALLSYWEVELTDHIIVYSKAYSGSPESRILDLMYKVIEQDAANLDHGISVWARRDLRVKQIFDRTIQKRFDHAAWMFRQAGFERRQAAIRGRLMVAYLMGETSTLLKSKTRWRSIVKAEFEILIHKEI